MSLNRITIQGRLTADPELRYTQTGTAVTNVTLAVDRDRKDQNGERGADFITVVAWSGTAEFLCKYFGKGRMAVVDGRLELRNWVDKDGNKRQSAEVVAQSIYFCGSRESAPQTSYQEPTASTFEEIEDDETLPF